MTATNWNASAKGTKVELSTTMLTMRDAWLAAHQETANPTTEGQWTAALSAAVTLMDSLTEGDESREFMVQVQGSDDGLIAAETQPFISVSVQRVI